VTRRKGGNIGLGERQVRESVATLDLRPLAALSEPLGCVAPDRLEHRVSNDLAIGSRDDEALVDERRQRVDHVSAELGRGPAYRDSLLDPTTTDEDREPSEQRPTRRIEQVVAPRDGLVQRPLMVWRVAVGPRQQAGPLYEPIEDACRAQERDPRRGQLDAKRQAVESRADVDDGVRILGGQPKGGLHPLGAIDEQADRGH